MAVILLAWAGPVRAGPIFLNFEGLTDNEPIANYYDGGLGGHGSGPGPSFGVTFAPNSLISIASAAGGNGGFSNQPSGVAVAYFLQGTNDFLNVPAGFSGDISFFYTASDSGSVNVYSGLNASGSLLASIPIASTNNNGPPGAPSNHWVFADATFGGTALSVDFSNIANVGTKGYGVDNLTLGAAPVPEPASLTLFGLGLLALGAYAWRPRGRAALAMNPQG